MSWCAGWALAQISSFFSLCFSALCHLLWNILPWKCEDRDCTTVLFFPDTGNYSMLWEMSWCAGWTLAQISSFFVFLCCFPSPVACNGGLCSGMNFLCVAGAAPSLWAVLSLSTVADLVVAGFSSHCCGGEAPSDSWWPIRTAKLCLYSRRKQLKWILANLLWL